MKDGRLSPSPKFVAKFWWKSLALLTLRSWTEAMLLHWNGLAVFVAQFRRPLCVDEVLLFAALLPLAFSN